MGPSFHAGILQTTPCKKKKGRKNFKHGIQYRHALKIAYRKQSFKHRQITFQAFINTSTYFGHALIVRQLIRETEL